MTSRSGLRRAARVRMVAQPASVPAARRFVDEALATWGRDDLVDDIGLSVTELATNATLHSASSFFDVELTRIRHGARLSVLDGGSQPAPQIAARADVRAASPATAGVATGAGPLGDADPLELESMTGRGLLIVATLAARWGIDDLPGGTRVWADFRAGGAGGPDEGDQHAEPPRVSPLAARRRGSVPPQGPVVPIRLLGCPPRLLLAHDDNLADFTRELALFGASHGSEAAARSAEQIAAVVRASAVTWGAARLAARHAVDQGLPVVDIAVASDPRALPVRLDVLRSSMAAAEAMAEAGLLMTLPAPPAVQRWRDWVELEMREQAATGRTPRPFPLPPD